jgi:outer membrane protein assembly factor BamB
MFVVASLACLSVQAVHAEQDWPQFRGRDGGVAADSPSLPDTWSETENVAWKIGIPGRGWSSPVVWGDHVFVTTAINVRQPRQALLPPETYRGASTGRTMSRRDLVRDTDSFRWMLYDVDATTGRVRWERIVHEGVTTRPVHMKNSYASETPVTDGQRVAGDERSNWSTPYVWQNDLRTEVVTVGGRMARSYDVDGKLLWELAVGTSLHTPTPFARNGLLYVSSGYFSDPRRPVFAIRPGASGNISLKGDETANTFITWSLPTASATYPSAIVVGNPFYTLLDRGFLTAHDAATGKEIYGRQRLSADAGAFSASPWSYNGKIFVLSEDGDTFVVQAGPQYKLIGRNRLNEMALASPAITGDSLFIRTATSLYKFAKPD